MPYLPKPARARPRRRGSSSVQGYGFIWRKLRAAILELESRCRKCGAEGRPGDHVDHIIPRSRGGTDSRENLQRLCRSCHSRKTADEDGGWGNPRKEH